MKAKTGEENELSEGNSIDGHVGKKNHIQTAFSCVITLNNLIQAVKNVSPFD